MDNFRTIFGSLAPHSKLNLWEDRLRAPALKFLFWPPAVYQDLRMHHGWLKMTLFHCGVGLGVGCDQVEGKFKVHLQLIIVSVGGPEQWFWCCLADVTNLGLDYACDASYICEHTVGIKVWVSLTCLKLYASF